MTDDPKRHATDDYGASGWRGQTEQDTSHPCHQCNCKGWFDPDNDGLCDGPNVVGPTGNRCQHPILTHF